MSWGKIVKCCKSYISDMLQSRLTFGLSLILSSNHFDKRRRSILPDIHDCADIPTIQRFVKLLLFKTNLPFLTLSFKSNMEHVPNASTLVGPFRVAIVCLPFIFNCHNIV